MKFNIVVPTFQRPAKLEKLFNSIIQQELDEVWLAENQTSIGLYVYFDNNDQASYNYFKEKFGSFFLTTYVLLNEQLRAFGIWNKHLSKMVADAMFYVCDDIEFAPDCIMAAVKVFTKEFPDTDGVLGLNQSNIAKNKEGFSRSAMGMIGRKFAERFPDKCCFCPDYTSFHADAELGMFARSIGKFVYCDDAKVIHYHPTYYKELEDETHRIVREYKDVDKEIWSLRQKKGLLWGQSFERVK